MVKTPLQSKALSKDGHEDVNRDGDPDLSLHSVLVGAIKGLDAQMLLDPFKKQLDLPATFVELGDDQSGKLKIVGEEAEPLVCLFVVENDVAQILRVVVERFYACETNCLIAAQPPSFYRRSENRRA